MVSQDCLTVRILVGLRNSSDLAISRGDRFLVAPLDRAALALAAKIAANNVRSTKANRESRFASFTLPGNADGGCFSPVESRDERFVTSRTRDCRRETLHFLAGASGYVSEPRSQFAAVAEHMVSAPGRFLRQLGHRLRRDRLHPWRLPRAVNDRRGRFFRPIESHHQHEFSLGGGKPVGFLVLAG